MLDVISPRDNGTITRERLAAWETEQYSTLRQHRDATTPVDDELPGDALDLLTGTPAQREELRRALRSL